MNIYQETIVINFNERKRFRLENEARQHSAIKVRYAWFWAKVGFIILVMTGYGAFGNAFANSVRPNPNGSAERSAKMDRTCSAERSVKLVRSSVRPFSRKKAIFDENESIFD